MVLSEIDLEIALKQRLADTLESRIEWALILKETLQKGHLDSIPNAKPLPTLSITESPSECILAREPRGPPLSHIRPPRRTNLPPTKTKPFLYIRSSALSPGGGTHLYRLQCPQCLRISFSSLQGLLNHARLAHNLEWGTHDECIRACAVPGNETDKEGGVEVGLGPAGVLPGLRTIFQMAVGTYNFQDEAQEASIKTIPSSQTPSITPHLTQTLGLHQDSAMLAPYLGKRAIRREIRVWDQDNDVDIESFIRPDDRIDQKHWKMPFIQRNSVTNSDMSLFRNVSQTSFTNHPEPQPNPKLSHTQPISTNQKLPSNQSRFYFCTRIIITDRSLWIPLEQRNKQNENHTHKWMISVDSPSYTYHVTSTLNSLTVTPLIPGMSTLPMTSEPPFVVVGTSNQPFLARIELSFTGASKATDQKVVLEHWVELDPLKTPTVVQGEDQVVDIELDKGTILKPMQSGYTPVGAKSLWDRPSDILHTPERPVKVEPQRCPLSTPFANYETILMDILPKFPMTQKDAKNCSSASTLPYKLISSPAHFKTLITGRRKAIEWGRARAIQDAYYRIIKQMAPGEDVIPLSVGDVYSWLSGNGHFPVVLEDQNESGEREPQPDHLLQQNNRTLERWCCICGLDVTAHVWHNICKEENRGQDMDIRKSVSQGPTGLSQPKSLDQCHIVPTEFRTTSLPVVDVWRIISSQFKQPNTHSPTAKYGLLPAKALVAIGDPLLTTSISRIVNALGLKLFPPLDVTAEHRKMDIERNIAPCALLAVMARLFIRLLVERGLEVVTRDRKNGASFSLKYQKKRNGRSLSPPRTTSMLTPTHILSGIVSRGRELDNLMWCLARVGVGVPDDVSGDDIRIEMEE